MPRKASHAGLVPVLALVSGLGIATSSTGAQSEPVTIDGLEQEVVLHRDSDGIGHIFAKSAHDLFLVQGWLHARDRLFQMDVLRRQASGTLAELFGPAALAGDVELRTVGLRRAAERSLAALTLETQAALDAYTAGINAFVDANDLPPEYGALELTLFEPWSPVDSLAVAKLLSFSLSFDLDIQPTLDLQVYVTTFSNPLQGQALYFEDTHRSAPFDAIATVRGAPGAEAAAVTAAGGVESHGRNPGAAGPPGPRPAVLELARGYLERIEAVPLLQDALDPTRHDHGSNAWVVGGNLTDSGRPFLASDPHLALDTPAIFYPIHLVARSAGYDVIGASLPGAPFVLLGHNRDLAWGATNFRADVTDTYAEQIVPCVAPGGLCTLFQGIPEPIIPLPQVFRVNQIGDGTPDHLAVVRPGETDEEVFIPSAVLIVPRRNQGPLVALDPVTGAGLSVQYTGFSGTREADAFRQINLAKSIEGVTAALQLFDVGAQHFIIAERKGNIAYFAAGELPLREDLQSGSVAGLPPFFIRNGQGGSEWLSASGPPPDQAVPYEILPFEEMPQSVNPPEDLIFNANNDPLGVTFDNDPLNQFRPDGGILYLGPHFSFGTRAKRIDDALGERIAEGFVTPEDMIEIQADTVLRDAQVFVPHILAAFAAAETLPTHPRLHQFAVDPRIAEAVGRLSEWNFTTPTGIFEGFDASDIDGTMTDPSDQEIADSVAATIYSVWRARMVINTIDATLARFDLPPPDNEQTMTALRNLFDRFPETGGLGASGIDFFEVPGLSDPATKRDFVILQSLAEALGTLASDNFAVAFGGSPIQDDYRWGMLHRLVLAHPLKEPFSLPAQPGPGVPGFALDGGFGTVDAATHDLRAMIDADFGFDEGPTRRYLGEATPGRGAPFAAKSSLPGGTSGVLGDPFRSNLLDRWLTNDTYRLRQDPGEIEADSTASIRFVP